MAARTEAYVAWLERRGRAILAASALIVAASAYLAIFQLPVLADLSDLLPSDVPAIRDLHRLEQRLAAKDRTAAVVTARDPATRAAAAEDLAAQVRAMPASLVAGVDYDDAQVRAFVRARAPLYVPLAELQAADRALAEQITRAKLRANPLYVNFDDDGPADARPPDALANLRARQAASEQTLARSIYVSADGRAQLLVIQTAFRATEAGADRQLQDRLDRAAAAVRARHPGVAIAFAGGVPQTLAEHDALVHGMAISGAITALLVALVLLVHLRSPRVLVALCANIFGATIVAFGFAAITVGHLNAATAFLGAIIAGNGINYGILLVARFVEERRALAARAAMARAIAGTVRPTLVASLGAAIAYGALAATHFKGFADFAIIGSLGMLTCWLASFVALPVLVLKLAANARASEAPVFGRIATRMFGFRRPAVVCAAGAMIAIAAAALTARYFACDPFEYDMTKLRSDAPAALAVRATTQQINDTFGKGFIGMSGSTYVAVDDPAQVPEVVAALAAARAREPMVGEVRSILDAVPPDQPAKLAVLADLRRQLDAAAGTGTDTDDDLAKLRPADDLRAFTAGDLPAPLRAKLSEVDGAVGTVITVTPSAAFDEWDRRDLVRFAAAIRELPLAGDRTVTSAGPTMIFADILTAIHRDGVVVTTVAIAALIAMVAVCVGRDRRAAAVVIATGLGSLVMIATCAVIGLKINFLDFIALPIALGLGIDYGMNVADRADRDDPAVALRSTGGTVLVCSLTTVIGYASLLASDNLAIRGFGVASLLGELACVGTALGLVPAIIALGAPGRARQSHTVWPWPSPPCASAAGDGARDRSPAR